MYSQIEDASTDSSPTNSHQLQIDSLFFLNVFIDASTDSSPTNSHELQIDSPSLQPAPTRRERGARVRAG